MKIVVIGGTGLIGSKVVAALREQGHEAVAASPRLGVNTITEVEASHAMMISQPQAVADVILTAVAAVS